MNNYEKMLAHIWIELNSKINKIESGEISPEDRAKLDAIPATASTTNPVVTQEDIPDITDLSTRVTTAEGEIDGIQAVIPSGASTSDKLALSSDIPEVTSLTNRVTAAEGDIDNIEAVIPSGASSSDKLALSSSVDYLSQLYGVVSEDVGNIQVVIPSGASTSDKLALSSDIPKALCVLKTVESSDWSSVVDSDGYYTNTVVTSDSFKASYIPDVYLRGSTNDTKPTAAEQAAWSLIDVVSLDDADRRYFTFKAKTAPTTTFYVAIKGEKA